MSERGDVLALLDELHATERAGAAAMTRWIAVAASPRLRGGLRVVAARDAAHAQLALARLEALGGTPSMEPTPARAELLRLVEAADVSDETKLRAMIARLPPPGGDRVSQAVARIEQDRETRALIETMCDDDRVSLAWLRAMGEPAALDVAPPGGDAIATGQGLAAFQAAEAASARVFEAWGESTAHDGLRGGLRTIAARETAHAQLLAERLAEVGDAGIEARGLDADRAVQRWGAASWSDERKLDALLARHDAHATGGPVARIVAVADAETAAMLHLIADGEHATISWLRAYRHALHAGGDRLDNANRFG